MADRTESTWSFEALPGEDRRGASLGQAAGGAEGSRTFSVRWRGKFEPAERDDNRYRALAKRYE